MAFWKVRNAIEIVENLGQLHRRGGMVIAMNDIVVCIVYVRDGRFKTVSDSPSSREHSPRFFEIYHAFSFSFSAFSYASSAFTAASMIRFTGGLSLSGIIF